MSQNAFIFMLVLGMSVLAGILIVVHVSSYRLKKRLLLRRQAKAAAEPELDLGDVIFGANEITAPRLTIRARHAESAR